jgi:hypothetical protein
MIGRALDDRGIAAAIGAIGAIGAILGMLADKAIKLLTRHQ